MDSSADIPEAVDASPAVIVNDATCVVTVAEAAPVEEYPPLNVEDLLDLQYGRPPREHRRTYSLTAAARDGLLVLVEQIQHVILSRTLRFCEYRGVKTIDERDLVMAVMSAPEIMPTPFPDVTSRPGFSRRGPAR